MNYIPDNVKRVLRMTGWTDEGVEGLQKKDLNEEVASGRMAVVPVIPFEPVLRVDRDIIDEKYFLDACPYIDPAWLKKPQAQEMIETTRSRPREIDYRPLIRPDGSIKLWLHRSQVDWKSVDGAKAPKIHEVYAEVRKAGVPRFAAGIPEGVAIQKQWGLLNYLMCFGTRALTLHGTAYNEELEFRRHPTMGAVEGAEGVAAALGIDPRPTVYGMGSRYPFLYDPGAPELDSAQFVEV